MGSVAERHYLRQEGHELLERGCAVYNSDVDDDAFSCRTDHTTVKASNVRRVTVRFHGIDYRRIRDWNPNVNCHFRPRRVHSSQSLKHCIRTVALVVANTLLTFSLYSLTQLSSRRPWMRIRTTC
jgi:hypothetical protein